MIVHCLKLTGYTAKGHEDSGNIYLHIQCSYTRCVHFNLDVKSMSYEHLQNYVKFTNRANYRGKDKGPVLDIALLLDEHMLRSALQSRKWQLTGMS